MAKHARVNLTVVLSVWFIGSQPTITTTSTTTTTIRTTSSMFANDIFAVPVASAITTTINTTLNISNSKSALNIGKVDVIINIIL